MKKAGRVLLRVLGFLLLVILVSLPVLYFLVRSLTFREAIHRRVIGEVEKATGGKVEFKNLTFDWKTQVSSITDFTLHGTETKDVAPLFHADSVEIGLRIDTLLRTSVRLASLVIRKPNVRIEVHADGSTNVPKPEVALKRTKLFLEEVVDLAIKRVEVEDGTIEYRDRRAPFAAHGDHVELRLAYEVPTQKYLGTFSSRKLHLDVPDFPKMQFDTDASLSVDAKGVDFRSLVLNSGQSDILAAGRVTNFEDLTAKLNVTAQLNLTEMWPPAVPGKGSGKVRFEGTFDSTDWRKYRLAGQVSGGGLNYAYKQYQATNASVGGQLDLNHHGLTLERLSATAKEGSFDGKFNLNNWKALTLDGYVKDVALKPLLAKQIEGELPWNGIVSGPILLECTVGVGSLCSGNARATIVAIPGQPPVSGFVAMEFNERDKSLRFSNSNLATEVSRVEFSGDLKQGGPVRAVTSNFEDLAPVLKLLGQTEPLPIQLAEGKAEFIGTITGDLKSPRVLGSLDLSSFVYEGQTYDSFMANVDVSSSQLNFTNIDAKQAPATITGALSMPLQNWKASRTTPIAASGSFTNLAMNKILPDISETGILSGKGEFKGTADHPEASVRIEATDLNINGQVVEKLTANVDFREGKLKVLDSTVSVGPLRMEAKAEYTPKGSVTEPASWKNGAGLLDLVYPPAMLSQWKQFRDLKLGVDGRLGWKGRIGFHVAAGEPQLDSLNGQAVLDRFQMDGVDVGALTATTTTKGNQLNIAATGKLRGSDVKIDGQSQLDGKTYPSQWNLKLSSLPFANLQELFKNSKSPFWQIEGAIAGEAQITGPAFDPDKWKGQIRIPTFELKPSRKQLSAKIPELVFRSKGPIQIAIEGKTLRLQQAKFEGKDTELEASGAFSLANKNPWDVRIKGSLELGLARTFNPDVIAAGVAVVDATVRGSLDSPQVYGKLELKNASLFFEGVPTGLDKVNGALLFDNKRATIDNKLKAQVGGGELTLAGFIEDAGKEIYYRLLATATRVRLRYPEGVSTLADANLTLTGSTSSSLLAGRVDILRSGFTPKSDLGSILAQASKATPPAPSAQSDLLKGMQFDVRILTAPNATLESTLTSDLQADADLRLRGSALRPSVLGRVEVNQGDINFFGNKYIIQRGEIGFYNSAKVEPIINMDLETRVRGVTVTVSFTGPINKLNVSYRSDPPLQSQEIIGLLTVGRDPNASPSVASAQTTQGDLIQNSANSLLGQALTAPVTGRLERLFGVSRLKIDPQLSSLEGTPQARITIEQQISRDITMTFVTNLARTQQQLVRLEWDINRQWSVVVVRDENGSFGTDFQYKKRFK